MSDKIKLLLETGIKLAGTATKEGIKLIPGGALVVAGAEVIGAVAETILGDVANRTLSQREQIRVGASAVLALNKVNELKGKCHPIREDDKFFAYNGNYRSSAEEALEGVLQKCKAEHEEKKIPYLSNIFAKAVFTSVSIEEINHVIKVADILTYRQLCILAVIKQNQENELKLRNKPGSSNSSFFALLEVLDLDKNSLIHQISSERNFALEGLSRDEFVELQSQKKYSAILDSDDITPAGLILSGLGRLVYELMLLDEIPEYELFDVIKAFK